MASATDEYSDEHSVFFDDELSHCSIPTSIIVIMNTSKHWTSSEINMAANVYFDSTQNAIKGTDQPHDDFKMDLLERWLKAGPSMPPPDTWSNRLDNSLDGAAKLHNYIRDYIIKPLQKFNSNLRDVELSEPTGTTTDMNLSMAYAIFLKKTNKVNYDYKYLDIKKWKLYTPYNMLKLMPKLMNSDATSITCSTTDDLTRGRGSKKGNKGAKKEQGEMKRKAFRDAERDRRVKRVVQKEDDAQDCLMDMTNEITEVRSSLDLIKDRVGVRNTEKNQRMVEKNQRMVERNERKVEKNEMMSKKIQVDALTAILTTETDPEKRSLVTSKLSQLIE
jgi:hypothetical protein